MQLYRLLYYSEAADNLTLQDVKSIAEKASIKNASLLISGGCFIARANSCKSWKAESVQ